MKNRTTLQSGTILAGLLAAAPAFAAPVAPVAPVAPASDGSKITTVTIAGTQALGTFHGVAYSRSWGTVSGVIAPGEKVEGLAALPKDAEGDYAYTSPFEVIAPSLPGASTTILVEAENRGHPIVLNGLDDIAIAAQPAKAAYKPGLGNGFLENHAIAYGRVSWQAGLGDGVPDNAQGVGEVIVRDFGRMLAAGTAPSLGRYRTLLLAGISQSAWFIDTFIAEGFNADPASGKRVYTGVIAIDGTGNWLALNQLAARHHAAEAPYFAPDARPLAARALLSRPRTDPFYIDVANYTDFYRVHASLTDTKSLPAAMRRYDWPSPHHTVTSAADAAATFSPRRAGGPCNGGAAVPLNPTSYMPFLRTLVVELAHQLGSPDAASAPGLPPSTLFKLGPAPAGTDHFNPLKGAALQVPLTGKNAEPEGGVRFPEVAAPLGAPTPVSLPPVITSAITGICGNIGGWQPATPAALEARYTDKAHFLVLYARAIDRLAAEGYLLPSEKAEMLATAAAQYAAPASYPHAGG